MLIKVQLCMSQHLVSPALHVQTCNCPPVQVTGVALATAGFIIATRWFGVPYSIVMFSHGKMGVAILVLVYSQVCVCV